MKAIAIINADIWSMEKFGARAQALLIRESQIKAVGTTDEILSLIDISNTEIIDARGRTVLPGFIDSHMHLSWYIDTLLQVDCRYESCDSIFEIQKLMKESLKFEEKWLIGYGYDENKLKEKRHPNCFDLDQISTDRPIMLSHISAHMIVVNSKALDICGINFDTIDPPDGVIQRDENGTPTGLLMEGAQNLVYLKLPLIDPKKKSEGLELACNKLLSQGITSVHDMGGEVFKSDFDCYFNLLSIGKLKTRINMFLPYITIEELISDLNDPNSIVMKRNKLENSFLRIAGLKCFADGSLIGKTAAMYVPYKDTDNTGMLLLSSDELQQRIELALRYNFSLAIHAIGEKAVDFCLNSYLPFLHKHNDRRFRIEHCGLINEEILNLLDDCGIYVSTQPIFIKDFGDGFISCLEKHEIAKTYAFKSLIDRNVHVGFSSDAAVSEINPISAIQSAIDRKTGSGIIFCEEEKIGLEVAIRCYTYEGAYGSFEENIKGMLAPGYLADVIMLSQKINEENFSKSEVVLTIFNGEQVYKKC